MQTELATFYETIATARANNHGIDITLGDMSSAFDKVWHDGLIYKIFKLQLPQPLTAIICDCSADDARCRQVNMHIDYSADDGFAVKRPCTFTALLMTRDAVKRTAH